MKPVPFSEYKDKFPHIKMERSQEGILLMTLHDGKGGEFFWGYNNHHEVAYVWRYVGDDPENKVIILTGSGNAFLRKGLGYTDPKDIERDNMDDAAARANEWIDAHRHGKRLEFDLMEVEQPMIACINGPVSIHAEIPLLCDIVLAAEHMTMSDAVHFEYGQVPGDGVQAIFPLLMGFNRARYFMLTGQALSAKECLDLGLVNEILPHGKLVERAYVLAHKILKSPAPVVKLFRPIVMQQVKRLMLDSVSHGLLGEALAFAAERPTNKITIPTTPYDKD